MLKIHPQISGTKSSALQTHHNMIGKRPQRYLDDFAIKLNSLDWQQSERLLIFSPYM